MTKYAIVNGTPEWDLMNAMLRDSMECFHNDHLTDLPDGEYWDPTGDAVVLKTGSEMRMKCDWSDWDWVDVRGPTPEEFWDSVEKGDVAVNVSEGGEIIVFSAEPNGD
ncbi:MAG: hypothetical protein IJV90_02720 [Candidatus Methanomethylophilaceae archaeon]|nr:hypothetical protein [Candidatus Methanomethylophilaceae archaeon]